MSMVKNYWNSERKYHHTAPINMMYGILEALRIISEEGLEARFARHILNHKALVAGVEAMGLKMLVPESERLITLNTVVVPQGVEDLKVRKALLEEFRDRDRGRAGRAGRKDLADWAHGPFQHEEKCPALPFCPPIHSESTRRKGGSGALEAAEAVYSKAA